MYVLVACLLQHTHRHCGTRAGMTVGNDPSIAGNFRHTIAEFRQRDMVRIGHAADSYLSVAAYIQHPPRLRLTHDFLSGYQPGTYDR